MDDYKYSVVPGANGDHILVFKFDGVEYVFERKVIVYTSEFRK